MDPRQYLQNKMRMMSEAVLTQLEARIHAGCASCGRRLVDNGLPIEGAEIVYMQYKAHEGQPMCGDCVQDPEKVKKVFDDHSSDTDREL